MRPLQDGAGGGLKRKRKAPRYGTASAGGGGGGGGGGSDRSAVARGVAGAADPLAGLRAAERRARVADPLGGEAPVLVPMLPTMEVSVCGG